MKPATKKTTVKLGASAVLATGITLASRFDLAISSALSGLTKTENVFTLSVPKFAALLEIIGEWAPSLLAATSVLIVGQESADLYEDRDMTAKLSSFVPATALMTYAVTKTAEYLKYPLSGALSAALIAAVAFVISAMLYLLIGKIPENIRKKIFLPAAYTLVASCAVLTTVSVIKTLWGRVRLRELVNMNSLEDYTPWYYPNFFSGSHSFPSGHTAHATLLLMLPKWLSGKAEKYRPALTVLCFGFIALMAFSRLAAGAHFLSDILFGFLIAFGITESVKKLYAHHDETMDKVSELLDSLQEKVFSYMKKRAISAGSRCRIAGHF
ncbi:MAG: phosphatase PAP2 family protein [Clostridia bacterium]|nr:phosphatase PAP2 family protein [Clostridia bacterium]